MASRARHQLVENHGIEHHHPALAPDPGELQARDVNELSEALGRHPDALGRYLNREVDGRAIGAEVPRLAFEHDGVPPREDVHYHAFHAARGGGRQPVVPDRRRQRTQLLVDGVMAPTLAGAIDDLPDEPPHRSWPTQDDVSAGRQLGSGPSLRHPGRLSTTSGGDGRAQRVGGDEAEVDHGFEDVRRRKVPDVRVQPAPRIDAPGGVVREQPIDDAHSRREGLVDGLRRCVAQVEPARWRTARLQRGPPPIECLTAPGAAGQQDLAADEATRQGFQIPDRPVLQLGPERRGGEAPDRRGDVHPAHDDPVQLGGSEARGAVNGQAVEPRLDFGLREAHQPRRGRDLELRERELADPGGLHPDDGRDVRDQGTTVRHARACEQAHDALPG